MNPPALTRLRRGLVAVTSDSRSASAPAGRDRSSGAVSGRSSRRARVDEISGGDGSAFLGAKVLPGLIHVPTSGFHSTLLAASSRPPQGALILTSRPSEPPLPWNTGEQSMCHEAGNQ